jgi:hypothetical protein
LTSAFTTLKQRARRSDGVWINYRTCDQREAKLVADVFGVAVTIAAGS